MKAGSIGIVLGIALLAVGISLSAIFLVLNRASTSPLETAFALAAAPLGWATLQVLAAFRYAHLYHAPEPDGGLDFPGTAKPGIWDFVYFHECAHAQNPQLSEVGANCSAYIEMGKRGLMNYNRMKQLETMHFNMMSILPIEYAGSGAQFWHQTLQCAKNPEAFFGPATATESLE
jgi:hypothetical protein